MNQPRLLAVLVIALISAFTAGPAGPASAATFTVNSTGDAPDLVHGNGACAINASSQCTLRAAIEETNALAGADVINFNINPSGDAGCTLGGDCTIAPASALPTIIQAVTIDGYTQPGASVNTNAITAASNAVLRIELRGNSAGAGANGLFITGGGGRIRGLAINGFTDSGIRVETGDGNAIEGNFIGTNLAGMIDAGNTLDGVGIANTSGDNCIGGTFVAAVCTPAPASRNVISGNDRDGVAISSAPTANFVKGNFVGLAKDGDTARGNGRHGIHTTSPANVIGGTEAGNAGRNVLSGNAVVGVQISAASVGTVVQNNYIGTDKTGGLDRGNASTGIATISSSSASVIGGSSAGQGNLISGNNLHGVSTSGSTNEAVVVAGNRIGTNAAGTGALPNAQHGVSLSTSNNTVGGTTGTTIGGACTGSCNVIAFNGNDGVFVSAGTGNQVRRNSVHSNGGLGIDLAPDGVTANDTLASIPPSNPPDLDTGPNNLQNFPFLDTAVKIGTLTRVRGAMETTPSTSFELEYFVSSSCDAAGNGEGATLGGVATTATGAGGGTSIGLDITAAVAVGQFITATATRTNAPFDTSELSNCVQVAPMVVDTTSFASLTACSPTAAADCSLLGAINNANGGGGADTITFNIPPSGAKTIQPDNPLPAIAEALTIDGTTQPGFAGSPIVELDGTNVSGSPLAGLRITSGAMTVRGLVINRFGGAGIETSTSANAIVGNYIGTNIAGGADLGNAGDGIIIGGANRTLNVIGGTVAADRNVISGNTGRGILITGNATNNTVSGNHIGTNAAGTADLGNTLHGVEVNGPSNTIGGSNGTPGAACTGACNVISGNGTLIGGGHGVLISGTTGNKINGNYIGTDVTGTLGVSNEERGIATAGTSSGTIIGNGDASTRNVVSGNVEGGILLSGGTSEGATVRGNFVGVDSSGSGGRPNGGDGVATDTSNNTIGGTVGLTPSGACTGDCNVISSNSPGDGVDISAGSGNQVLGNHIGTDVSGTLFRSNGSAGVRTTGTASANIIGDLGVGNLISGNGSDGILLSGAGGNTATANRIGVETTGTAALGNNGDGVEISSPNNYVYLGVISGNVQNGVRITGATATGNTVEDAFIGVDTSALVDLGNSADGVHITAGASGNFIGNGNGPENTVAGNGGQGIEMNGAGVNNVVLGNIIGKFSDGSGHGNGSHGVLIVSTNDADIGHLTQAGQLNFILGNGGDGVHVTSGTGTLISRNTVRDSGGDGVHVAGGTGHRITTNIIERSAGLAIDLVGGTQDANGVTANDGPPDSDSGANNLQNYPVITIVDYDFVSNVQGTLDSAPNTTYTLQFFYGDVCDSSGHGEAATFLFENTVVTDGAGHDDFFLTFPTPPGFTIFHPVSATATDPAGNTSEFSACQLAANDENDDDDIFLDTLETACGSNPMDVSSLPERTDTAGDDDGDGAINEALPSTALPVDCDRDGFTGQVETGAFLCIGTGASSAGARNDDSSEDATVNDGCPAVGAAESDCTDTTTTGLPLDDDADGAINDGCPAVVTPESLGQCTGATDDDGDGLINEGCAAVDAAESGQQCLNATDNDGDGAVNDGCPAGFSEAQFKIGTSQQDPCGNNGWPLDLVSTVPSANEFDIVDLGSFVSGVRKLGKNPNQAGFDARWDLEPGHSNLAGSGWINIVDLGKTTGGPTAFPPMLGGVKVLNQVCPFPP